MSKLDADGLDFFHFWWENIGRRVGKLCVSGSLFPNNWRRDSSFWESRAAARTEERGREKTSLDIFEKKNQPHAKKRCLVYPPLFLCHFHTHEKALFFSRRQQPTLMRALLPLAFWDAFFGGGGGFGLQGGRDDHYSKAKTKRSRGKKILTTLSEKNIWG